jgi:hypothetical protein
MKGGLSPWNNHQSGGFEEKNLLRLPGFEFRTFQPAADTLTISTELSQIPVKDLPTDFITSTSTIKLREKSNTVEPGYNNIGLCDTPPITSDILWYHLIPQC